MQKGVQYEFLKEGQRAYWLDGEHPLLEKLADCSLSPPKASIIILEVTHFKKADKIYTRGKYLIVKVLHHEVYFNGCEPTLFKKTTMEHARFSYSKREAFIGAYKQLAFNWLCLF